MVLNPTAVSTPLQVFVHPQDTGCACVGVGLQCAE